MGINNVSNQPQEMGSNNLSLQNNSKRYFVNPNAVDKTPQSDTVQLSNKKDVAKKVGIGAAIVGTGVGLFYLLRGKKPPTKVMEQVAETVVDTKPKMVITEEAKKIYDDVSKKIHKKTQVTLETIDDNLKPKEKAGSWSSDDMKEFYTKLEKESDAKKIYDDVSKTFHKKTQVTSKTIDDNLKPKEKAGSWSNDDMKEFYTKLEKESDAKIAEEKAAKELNEWLKQIKAKEPELIQQSFKYVDDHMKELDDLFLDDKGNLMITDQRYGRDNFKNLITSSKSSFKELYHVTTPENKSKILKEGFSLNTPVKAGRDGVGGIYFSPVPPNKDTIKLYGGEVIKIKLNGKLAESNRMSMVNNLKNCLIEKLNINKLNINNPDIVDLSDALSLRERMVERYLQNKLKDMGYVGIYSSRVSGRTTEPYISALDPKNIQILK